MTKPRYGDNMSMEAQYQLSEQQIAAINRTLNHGERVELFRDKNGIRIIKVKRRDISLSAESGG